MRNALKVTLSLLIAGLILVSCDEGTNDDNSSARVTGYVYNSPGDPTGVSGVQVILEGMPNAENAYEGPDRWTVTDETGKYDAWIFVGSNPETGGYQYSADFLVQIFYQGARVDSIPGVTLGPGSVFTMPPSYINN